MIRSVLASRLAFFLSSFALALVTFLPLGVGLTVAGLPARGLAAREASGTVWSGHLADAHWGAARLGDLNTRTSLSPLIWLELRLRLRGRSGNGPEGALIASPFGVGLSRLTARLDLGEALAPLPLAGFEFNDASVSFDERGCTRASGSLRAIASPRAAALGLPQSYSGMLRCEDGLLMAPLTSQSGMEMIELRIGSTGRYAATLTVRPADPAAASRLQAAGLRRSSRGYSMRFRGILSGTHSQ